MVFTKITLWWKVVKPWTIDIGLWYYQEDIKKNPMKEQELNKDHLLPEQIVWCGTGSRLRGIDIGVKV